MEPTYHPCTNTTMPAFDYTKYRTTPGVAAPSGTRSSTSNASNGAPAPTSECRVVFRAPPPVKTPWALSCKRSGAPL
ncbi:hypothetical protein PG996_016094 [Apiospora saccharicola]|uniref:Uncharacterized protein n=1 Tax=Apiospora saccharicola TaxID=335842 RepID=A0ABR1TN00_9PEZI